MGSTFPVIPSINSKGRNDDEGNYMTLSRPIGKAMRLSSRNTTTTSKSALNMGNRAAFTWVWQADRRVSDAERLKAPIAATLTTRGDASHRTGPLTRRQRRWQ